MWLLDTSTLTLHEFHGENIPPYAILSHRWGDEEVTFRHLSDDFYFGRKDYLDYNGWAKISKFCELAKERGLKYAWVDTCCIDKSSSAELSEAINSMYKWYENAKACYIYLSDVHLDEKDETSTRDSFRKSQWFERGWTLQELLAPSMRLFFDFRWKLITHTGLLNDISEITGIDRVYLDPIMRHRARRHIPDPSIAQRMSWAANRRTTKEEDIAYCLIGIFEVNMPLLYGEGARKAFLRLQEGIIKVSDDETIFAWDDPDCQSILANSPQCFAGCQNMVEGGLFEKQREPYELTHRGFRIELDLRPMQGKPRFEKEAQRVANNRLPYYHYAKLKCAIRVPLGDGYTKGERVGLFFTKAGDIVYRVGRWILPDWKEDPKYKQVYVRQFNP